MLRLVQDAGRVPRLPRERRLQRRRSSGCARWSRPGAIGRVLTTFRAREGHSGPHAAHFWDAELAGGGALLDMASHGVEAARYMFGKDVAVREVFAWGATLVHGDRTTGEDNAVDAHPLRGRPRRDDGRLVVVEGRPRESASRPTASRADRPGHQLDARSGRSSSEPAGYIGEKADADTGWVYPVPDETQVHGHDAMMADVVEAFRDGVEPRETFEDGLVVNSDPRRRLPLDAERPLGSRSRSRPCPGRPPDDRAGHVRARARVAARGDRPARRASRRPRPTRSSRPASGAPRRSPRAGWSTASGPATRGSRSRRCSRATARTRASTRWSSCR